jgi:hypothetical protein
MRPADDDVGTQHDDHVLHLHPRLRLHLDLEQHDDHDARADALRFGSCMSGSLERHAAEAGQHDRELEAGRDQFARTLPGRHQNRPGKCRHQQGDPTKRAASSAKAQSQLQALLDYDEWQPRRCSTRSPFAESIVDERRRVHRRTGGTRDAAVPVRSLSVVQLHAGLRCSVD